MKIIKNCFAAALAAIITVLFVLTAFASEKADTPLLTDNKSQNAVLLLNDPTARTISVSRRGLWHSYPENSLEAICAAAATGIDFVMTDIGITKDGVLVLFADDNALRMTGTQKAISEITWEELSSYKLKNAAGGKNSTLTEYSVCTLENALIKAKEEGFCLMPKVKTGLVKSTYELIKSLDMLNDTCVYIEGKQKEITSALLGLDGLNFITSIKSNIVFLVTSFIDDSFKLGASGVNLMTKNRYGVNFNNTVLKHFNGTLRAVAAPCDSETCGAREDTVKWWDDLISRGYSVIITDEPMLFSEYVKSEEAARARLEGIFEKYTENWKLPEFKSYIFNDYKKAYNDAYKMSLQLINDKSASVQSLNDAAAALQSAADNIDAHYTELEQGTAGMTITVPRIILCVLAAAAVIIVQIFFYKKRKKA